MKINDLLTTLSWPSHALDKKGTLTYTKSEVAKDPLDPSGITCISVIVSAGSTKIRIRTTSEDGQALFPVLDAEWDIADTQAVFKKFMYNRQKQSLDEAMALTVFRNHVRRLDARPQFQGFGPRVVDPTQDISGFQFDV